MNGGARIAIAIAIAIAAVGGCDQGDPPRRPQELPPITAAVPTLDLDAALAAASAAAETSAKAPPAPAGEAGAFAGSWEGKYDAKKATLGMPPKVKDKARAADQGKVATGSGTIALTIAPGGDVRGRCKGALGDGALVGKVDGSWVRATLMPDDATANAAMTGVFVGKLADGKIEGEVRAAGPDALLVREATCSLAKK